MNFCVLGGDFKEVKGTFWTVFDLGNLPIFSAGNDFCLDFIFLSKAGLFMSQMRASMSNFYHYILKVCPNICGKRVTQGKCFLENLAHSGTVRNQIDFSFLQSNFCETLGDLPNFCFNNCCPSDSSNVQTDGWPFCLVMQTKVRSKVKN